MNRDRYSILLNKAKQVIEINMQHVTGKWEKTPVHEDVVKGFLCCKCILVLVRNSHPEQQGFTPLIDSWDKLITVHHPENAYRLLPLKAQTVSAFAAMMAICQTPGTPFNIDYRTDHVPYRCALAYKSPVRRVVEEFFDQRGVGRLPFDRIDFDAVMLGPELAGLVVVRTGLSKFHIDQYASMMKFITSPALRDPEASLDLVPWDLMLGKKHRFCFLASESPVPLAQEKSLAAYAKENGLVLYHRKGNDFQYISP